MMTISRESALMLIVAARSIVKKQIDLSKILGINDDTCVEQDDDTESDFIGVSNGFLSEIVYAILGVRVEVKGNVEELYPCPCCGLKTLTECYDTKEGTGYDICRYCNWEDDGTIDTSCSTSVNKGSIEDYRNRVRENSNKFYINKWFSL